MTDNGYQRIVKEALASLREAEANSVQRWRICPATAHLHENYRRVCSDCLDSPCARFHELGLDDQGEPLPRKKRPLCGAKTRSGGTCQMRVVAGKRRCRLHGGLSTGPKTAEGKARIRAAQRARLEQLRMGAPETARECDELPVHGPEVGMLTGDEHTAKR